MIYAIISTVLDSIWTNIWKKALNFNMAKEPFSMLAYSSLFFMLIVLYFLWKLQLNNLGIYEVFLILIIFIIWYFRWFLLQYVYKNDKISKILPYQNISKILTIIIGFFIFADTSIITLFIAIFTALIIFIFSFDFKKIYIPKTIKTFWIAEIMYSVNILLLGVILTKITNISYFVYSYIVWLTIIWIIVILKKQLNEFIKVDKKFYIYRLSASHIWWVSYILSLLVMQELWVIMSILISYIWLWSTLLFSFLIFKDKPSKKDLLLLILVSILITVWFYYK